MPSFKPKTFPTVANTVFSEFISAHRRGDLSALASVTTEHLLSTLKGEILKTGGRGGNGKGPGQGKKAGPRGGAAQGGGGDRAAFEVVRFLQPTVVVQMWHHRKGKGSANIQGWGQVTCLISSEREVVRVDSTGREVAAAGGKEEGEREGEGAAGLSRGPVTSNVVVGVFEASFSDPLARWRLALVEKVGSAAVRAVGPQGASGGMPPGENNNAAASQ